MNFYNPYTSINPYMSGFAMASKPGIFSGLSGLTKKLNFSTILNGTGRTLNLINQAIPVIKQARPMINNAKTMFRVMNEFKKVDSPNEKINIINPIQKRTANTIEKTEKKVVTSQNAPTFFL